MNRFWGVLRYEYAMMIRRPGFWIAFALLSLPYAFMIHSRLSAPAQADAATLPELARSVYMFNLFMPVFAGVVLADRLVRDDHLSVAELLHSTPLRSNVYIAAKYLSGLLAVLTPTLLAVLLMAGLTIAVGHAPLNALPIYLLAFLGLTVPAYAFIAAFSLACPAVLPVRVYQILFTGYWFWGNYLNSDMFPTLAGTLLTPNGEFVLEAFFGSTKSGLPVEVLRTPTDAILNLLVLAACSFAALFVLDRFMAWRSRRA